jgi:hypothetical protein
MAELKFDLAEGDAVVDALMSDFSRQRYKFIDKVDMDRVVAAILRLGMEISVLRDRLDTHENLAGRSGGYTFAEVDAYQPTVEESERRNDRRAKLVARIVRDLAGGQAEGA